MLFWLFYILVGPWSWGCAHKWEILREGAIVNGSETVTGYYYFLRCSKCGEIKYCKSHS